MMLLRIMRRKWNFIMLKKQCIICRPITKTHFSQEGFEVLKIPLSISSVNVRKSSFAFGFFEVFWRYKWCKTWWGRRGGGGESIGHWLIKIILFMETRIPEKIIGMFAWFFSIKSIFKETKHLLMNRMKALV